ncbi:putative ABC transport system ATP-binding protein [Streptoalloteichus tenebrarius]|uniref:ABC transport system ATP-binding protein n=1 Tax=Streptoalloteichus tenebrarius (strain ATCC 17920 / DSM 40477 / JCM 4838 / CBS 697.72 / NBRC 16177 / NCIMB 11028 / NRRL B-12390 / A12253. 1 / ISP 5477) TaxID=1933 RepID=A0ABT1I0K6_STRSD|nr:ABC transporter ATP-binding protein [Streptoalloteichus tenebrarius]MCP2261313.1 putative ABC transport system ATP-binding protein [Streptoalloteichus tenebrarius]BFF03711.1 ABC transporter ATP-binding protein [Streptoalloteichus tenebrarius]
MPNHCELLGVRKQYGGRKILDDFSLQIEAGEMVALTGASGSGKSTLLNIIGLLDAPDGGEVRILGDRAPKPRSRAANRILRHHLGYLFQNFALIDSESVAHNLEIALTYSGRATSKQRRIAEALEQVGLPGAEERKVFSLSGGEQQRVAVARLLLKPCDIVLADEPTGSLDAENRDIVLSLLRSLNEAGKTIVIATHDKVVAGSCSRLIALGDTTTASS